MADTLTLTNPIPITGEGGGTGGSNSSEIMHVNITHIDATGTSPEYYEIDKTYNELLAAVNDGKIVVGKLATELSNGTENIIHQIEIPRLGSLVDNPLIDDSRYRASFDFVEVVSASPDGIMSSLGLEPGHEE